MTRRGNIQHQSGPGSPVRSGSVILRLVLVLEVSLAFMVWPEQLDPTALLLALLLVFVVVALGSVGFCLTLASSFLVATLMALAVYGLLAPQGLFDTAWQDSGATDSQFFLHESRRFLSEDDSSALFSTWGSLVPVLYGAISLKAFGGHYLGIVFANCLLYSASVFLAARLLGIPRHGYRLLPLLGLLPMQGFYNSMLAKEPIYLFLIVLALYAFLSAVGSNRLSWRYLFLFAWLAVIVIVFRPTGAMLLGMVALVVVAMKFGLARASFFLAVFTVIAAVAVTFANYIDYFVPLFFIGSEGGVDFANQAGLSLERAATKLIPGSLMPLFLPPWSAIASPLLGLLWMVSPLPLMGQLIAAFLSLFAGSFSFIDFAVIVRYLDSIMILLLVLFLVLTRINRAVMFNPLVLFGILHVLSTVTFQFFESGRHRYLPGFILAVLVVSIISRRRNLIRSSQHSIVDPSCKTLATNQRKNEK